MAHTKKHGPGPVPPANRPRAGLPGDADVVRQGGLGAGSGSPFQEQDPKRRIGGFEGAGEHPRQQPSRLNDGQRHSR